MEFTNNQKTTMQKQINNKQLRYYLEQVAIIILVVAVGLFAINQGLEYKYKAQFLLQPCGLCADLNPGVEDCIKDLNKVKASYWSKEGWSNPFNLTEYNITLP